MISVKIQMVQDNLSNYKHIHMFEWTRKIQIKKEQIPGSRRSIHGYILTYPRLQSEKL